MRRAAALLLAAVVCLSVAACRSQVVSVLVVNESGETVRSLELRYPNASFGRPLLTPGEKFHYVIRTAGAGEMRLKYVDGAGKEFESAGPQLEFGHAGNVLVRIGREGKVQWEPELARE